MTTTEDTKKHNDVGMVTAVKEKMGGGIGDMIDCSRFELLQKLLWVTCFVQLFALNLKAKQMGCQEL